MTQKEALLQLLREVPGVEVKVVRHHGEQIFVVVGEITSANVAEYFTALLTVLRETRKMLSHKACCFTEEFDEQVCRLLRMDQCENLPDCHPYHHYRLKWDDGSLEEAARCLPQVVADYTVFALMDDTPLTVV